MTLASDRIEALEEVLGDVRSFLGSMPYMAPEVYERQFPVLLRAVDKALNPESAEPPFACEGHPMTPRGETGNDFGVRPTAEGSAAWLDEIRFRAERGDGLCLEQHTTNTAKVGFDDEVWVTCGDRELGRLVIGRSSTDQSDAIRYFMCDVMARHERAVAAAVVSQLLAAEPPKPKAEDPG